MTSVESGTQGRLAMKEAMKIYADICALYAASNSRTISELERKRLTLSAVRKVRDYSDLLIRAGALFRRGVDQVQPTLEDTVKQLEGEH